MTAEGYLIELQQIGARVRVTAVDPATGREAVIQGPASAGEAALVRVATRKLDYILGNSSGPPDAGSRST